VPTLTINGIEVEVEHGTTVLEAARFLGIPIPTLCHDDGLVPYGACRLCLVEVSSGKKRNLQASCCLPAGGVHAFGASRTGAATAGRDVCRDLPAIQAHSGHGVGNGNPAVPVRGQARDLHPVRAMCAHVRATDDGRGNRIRGTRPASRSDSAVRHDQRVVPAVRCVPLCLPGLRIALPGPAGGDHDVQRLRKHSDCLLPELRQCHVFPRSLPRLRNCRTISRRRAGETAVQRFCSTEEIVEKLP